MADPLDRVSITPAISTYRCAQKKSTRPLLLAASKQRAQRIHRSLRYRPSEHSANDINVGASSLDVEKHQGWQKPLSVERPLAQGE